jgi:predicted peroxiredoxin
MGLKMADVMSQDKKVLVYFDVEGIQVVLQESQEISKEGFPSAQEQIQALTDQGITIFACPSCLNAAGKTEEDLIEGVKLAEKEAFFSFTDGRIITFDY